MTLNDNRINEIVSNCINDKVRRIIEESHANCYGVPRGLLEYRKSEWEGILIVERRSVAAYIYRNEIKQIIDYIDNLISSGNIKNQFHILKNVGFAKECVLLIYFTNEDEGAEYQDEYTEIVNGITERVAISLYINPYRHNKELFSQFLYHEINHCKDDIQRRLNGKPSLTDTLKGTDSKIKYQQAFAMSNKDKAAYLVYHLFVDTELNATVSQFYSELENSNTQREQFDKFFNKSRAFNTYDGFMFVIEQLEQEKGWEEQAMRYFNARFKSVSSFRSWFLHKAKFKATKFYNKLCKVANLYYDTIEGKIK